MLDELELQSGFARRWLLDSEMMTSEQEIAGSYDVLRHFVDFVRSIEPSYLNTLLFRLQGVKDIRTTIKNLRQQSTLDDIELFEVKHLAILSTYSIARRSYPHPRPRWNEDSIVLHLRQLLPATQGPAHRDAQAS